jgi:Flp pilus assembly protein TadG
MNLDRRTRLRDFLMLIGKQSAAGRRVRPRGTIAPLVALVLVTMIGFLALSIDVGMLAIAKTQVQQAADLAALTAARTVSGNSSNTYNESAATTNAQNILTYNVVLGQTLQASQLQLTFGSYDYSQTTQTFSANYPRTAGQPDSAAAATVTVNSLPVAFGSVFGNHFFPNVTATAQAVHRPRDISLVMDLSGSMRLGTCLGYDFYTSSRTTNNADPLVPTFGHYSSSSAVVQGPATNRISGTDSYTIFPSNTTAPNSSYTLTYVNNFFQNAAYASPLVRAFDSYTSTDGGATWSPPSSGTPVLPPTSYATVPGGDVPLFKSGSTTTYATTVKDVVGSTTRNAAWELDGYSNYTNGTLSSAASGKTNYSTAPFYGYTQGPGYYGTTFFIWPPDPRQPLSSSSATQFKQFYTDFGYNMSGVDATNSTYWQPLYGIYNSASSTPGDHNWPWPNDGGVSLGTYLTTRVYIPGGSRKLKTTDSQYQQIMRLYNWNYVVDNVGTTPCDWRVRFFGTNNNTKLFNTSNGQLNAPSSSTYTINYNEILRWITEAPNPFPTQMRAGRIKYYGSIPTSITGSWPSYGSTDQRFWVEFIDYVLGFRQTSAGVYQDVSAMAGYGVDFTWGTNAITAPPGSLTQYMSYTDNPDRPLLRYWFGPMAMVDYLQNYNMDDNVSNYNFMQPGDSYEAPIYTAKQAYIAAISTMQTNHPNDWVTVVPYSWPRTSSTDTSGRLNIVRSPLGTNYNYASAAILFPFSTINANGSANNTEITPYTADPATGLIPSADFSDTPRADGDTSFAMGLMLSYNQFAVTPVSDGTLRSYVTSSPITFPSGMAGGLGRKGTQKVIIFETDGLANCSATANLVNAGSYSYYKIRYNMNNPSSSEYPSINPTSVNDPTVLSQVYSLVQQLANDYGTSRNPFRLYALGFGPVFQGPDASQALSTLQSMQYYAGTQTSAGTALPPNQIITGTDAQMSAAMINTFTSILQSGVQIALIK